MKEIYQNIDPDNGRYGEVVIRSTSFRGVVIDDQSYETVAKRAKKLRKPLRAILIEELEKSQSERNPDKLIAFGERTIGRLLYDLRGKKT